MPYREGMTDYARKQIVSGVYPDFKMDGYWGVRVEETADTESGRAVYLRPIFCDVDDEVLAIYEGVWLKEGSRLVLHPEHGSVEMPYRLDL